jgi:hypothetical protein
MPPVWAVTAAGPAARQARAAAGLATNKGQYGTAAGGIGTAPVPEPGRLSAAELIGY